MILVATGMHFRGFDRLVKGVDELVGAGLVTDEVFLQTGYASYVPVHCDHKKIVPFEELEALLQTCRVLITHGGAGLIADGLELGKPVISVPRRKQYNECVNDHQLDLTGVLEDEGRLIVVHDVRDLPGAIERASRMEVVPPCSGEGVMRILEDFLDSLVGPGGSKK